MSTLPATTIAVAPARKMDDYREALRVAGITSHELVVEDDAPDAVVARHGGLLLLGGSDVDPALYGEERAPDHRGGAGAARRVRDRAGQGRHGARPADLRHLPRHPAPERRPRRQPRAGHPDAGACSISITIPASRRP